MSNLKDGKKPLSQKAKPVIGDDFEFGNKLYIEPALKAKAKAEGLELRFINAKKLYANSGYHDKGWTPYKVDPGTFGTLINSSFKFGNDPEGVIRRGEDSILACRSIERGDKHRLLLQDKAARHSNAIHKKNAEDLSEAMGRAGLGKALVGEEGDE